MEQTTSPAAASLNSPTASSPEQPPPLKRPQSKNVPILAREPTFHQRFRDFYIAIHLLKIARNIDPTIRRKEETEKAEGIRLPFSRMRWSQLDENEKKEIWEAIGNGMIRTVLGGVLGAGILVGFSRLANRTRIPLDLSERTALFTSLIFPSAGAYLGYRSSLQTYVNRTIALPDSDLARDVQLTLDNRALTRFLIRERLARKVGKSEKEEDDALALFTGGANPYMLEDNQ